MDIKGTSPFEALQSIANVEEAEHGDKSVADADPFTLSKKEFMTGADKIGFSEATARDLWAAFAKDNQGLTKADFDVREFTNIEEIGPRARGLMQYFIQLMTQPQDQSQDDHTADDASEGDFDG